MNVTCESDSQVLNEHAVRCSLVTKPAFIVEYVRSISSLVGASHILAVFEENEAIKVFFDDRRHAEALIRNCLHVMGHHVSVDYVIPPGTKLILSNVDPVISDYDIMRLLTVYGNIVSPVYRPPISDDVELCHIGYGVRHVYMELTGCIPEKLEFKYGEQFCLIKIKIDEHTPPSMLPYIKTDNVDGNQEEVSSNSTVHSPDTLSGPSGIDKYPILESIDPVLVSVQSIPESNSKEIPCLDSITEQSSAVKASTSGSSIESKQTEIAGGKKRRGRPLISKRKEITVVSKAAKKIKRNVKRKWIKSHYKKGRRGRMPGENTILSLRSIYDERSSSSSSCSSTLPELSTEERDKCVVNKVLDETQLQMYLVDVKGHRAPLELAKKYIGEDCDVNIIRQFIRQLHEYKMTQEINLKHRILRVIKSITDALSSEDSGI